MRKFTTAEFVSRSINIHGNLYDYSKVEYESLEKKVKIICKIHGEFDQSASSHLSGAGCRKCYSIRKSYTIDVFVEKANKVHNMKYDYTKSVYVHGTSKICIICSKHGEFYQTPTMHLSGQGCPKCKTSRGEKEIIKMLVKNNINFIHQHKFEKCKGIGGKNGKKKRMLPFDFYLPDFNCCIEFDGQQHFKLTNFNRSLSVEQQEENLTRTKITDSIKNDFCKSNGIKLIRIPYWRIGSIEKILDSFFEKNDANQNQETTDVLVCR